ncbi:hypothetical protein PIIN_09667 [Serendipita indica DSM 11827]|uniref:Endonuclease/exonuclease/phosphatase domain-containing protein n=1 Tax=Serendipita indica (strain DSM 11827) TaxID=1109443 RepID=G4TWI4_SERID|nr:hypothetical protein PIIN_09667 [Serendipita indica DSM 11827]
MNNGTPLTTSSYLRIIQINLRKSFDAHHKFINTASPDNWDVIAIQEPALNSLGNTRANRKCQSFYPSTKAHEGHGRIHAVMLVSTRVGACMQIDVDSSDIVGIRVGTASGLCTIYNIYNEGTSNDTLDQLTQHLETRNMSTWANQLEVWLGDFNRHHHTWEGDNNRHLRSSTDAITPLLNLIIEHGMQQLLPAGIPTREENGSQTRPDNVWASDDIIHRLVECNTWPDLRPTTTDHIPIASIINLSVAKVAITPRPNYRRTNWEKFREGMEDAVKNDPRLAIEPTRPEELEQLVELLTGYMQTKLKDMTPLSKDPTFCKPWWNKQCQDLHKCKYQAYTESRYWQASPAHPSHQRKEAFWWKWIDEASDTDLWNINRFIKRGANNGSSERIPPLKKPNGTLTQSNEEKAELLCDAFFPPPPALALPRPRPAPQTALPQWTPYSIKRVSKAVGRLKRDKAPGLDGIPNAAIQEALPAISPILKNVFNAAIRLRHIPKQWKESTTVVL